MIDKLKNLFNYLFKNKFLLYIFLALFTLSVIGSYQFFTKKKGTWSKYFVVPQTRDKYAKNYKPSTKKNKDSSGEIECRKVLEEIFKVQFKKARPDFLNNPVTGGDFNLELDCYSPELNLAVEYNGQQHYKFIPFFHKNKEAFYNQKYRDELKRRMCEDNMITLIEVPYTVKVENIQKYLIQELFKKGYITN
jgi:hypothetical protein